LPELTPEREEIANRIRTLRRAREISIEKLAALAQISAGYLSEVERGHSEISGAKLARLAENLGTTVDYLLTGREEQVANAAVTIPPGLSEAAKKLDLSYSQTLQLLRGKEQLVARRSARAEQEWTAEKWIEFYNKVRDYLQ
jgi:transcriptional regulator with XRE-family HTH domain